MPPTSTEDSAAHGVVRVLHSIADIDATQWNALELYDSPFLRHEFLLALERERCVGRASGWMPHHLVLEYDGALHGAVPLYLKTHSWGEFVFDWSWARAYSEAGLTYYPKLVSMVPFTPAPGARLLCVPHGNAAVIRRQLIAALLGATGGQSPGQAISSAHVLFLTDADRDALAGAGFLLRKDCQFHWRNRGYANFTDFLATFRADKRKKALRERRRIAEAGITFRTLRGSELDERLWHIVFAFSAATFAARGHDHYLTAGFLSTVARALPDAIMVKLAMHREEPIAAAIFFQSQDTLYGRYWGAAAEFHSLHFETCYYQGVEYCIEQGLQRFEPGTQGEHKVARGFEPAATWSAHWIAEPRFRRAIDAYLAQERDAVDGYMASVRDHVPFHRE